MKYWRCRILFIDLEEKKHWVEDQSEEVFLKWIGGKGLAGYFLKPYINLDWNDSKMPVIITTGPLVGTASPTSGRSTIMSKSPLTGTVGDTSVGGDLGTQLRKAGFDGIVITGNNNKLCGIEIDDQSISFTDASQLTQISAATIYKEYKQKGSVACIGPAAENGVYFSNIMVDGSFSAGRVGLGLSLANKNIKYITVKGSGKIPVFDEKGLKTAREDIFRLANAAPILMGEHGIAHYGTSAVYDLMDNRRMMPTSNFKKTKFEHAKDLNAVAFKKKYAPKRTGCKGCHILCKKVANKTTHMPEFENLSHLTALIENNNIDVVVEANTYCNEAGMDTISAAATLACYAEIRGKKLNADEIVPILKEISSAEGIGKELGLGSYRYAKSKGKTEASMSVKGLELPAYDPRGAYGMSLGYATSTRGGCHLRAYPIGHEILRKPVVTQWNSFEGKARIIKISEDINAIIDSLTACKFVFFGASLEEYSKAFTAVTGIEMQSQDLMHVGERIYYNERIMNSINGFTSKEDDLPERFFTEEGSSGDGIEIKPINRDDFLHALQNYYKVRGLDKNGIPTKEKTEELNLDF